MSKKNLKAKHVIFYQLQPVDEDSTDFCLHLRPEKQSGVRALKIWIQRNLYVNQSFYDKTARCRTIKNDGKHWLKELYREFIMIQGGDY